MLKRQKHEERTRPSRGRHCQTWRGRCIGSWSRWPGLFPLSPFSISWQQSIKWKQCQSRSQTRGQGKLWKAKSTLKPSVIILRLHLLWRNRYSVRSPPISGAWKKISLTFIKNPTRRIEPVDEVGAETWSRSVYCCWWCWEVVAWLDNCSLFALVTEI